MALDTELRAISYSGNNSTSQSYPITFAFLGVAEHVKVRIKLHGQTTFTVLFGSDYTVHGAGGASPYVTTAVAYPTNATVELFRWLPYLQPVVFPEGGKLPSAVLEMALDRVTMLAMQADPDGGYSVPATNQRDTAVWANAAARGAVQPSRAGQLGVQLDNQSVWIAQSTTTGDWGVYPTGGSFQQLASGSAISDRLTLAFVSDIGDPGAAQDAVVATVDAFAPDYVLDGGDNSYNADPLDWAVWQEFIDAEQYLRVRGNHSLDNETVIDNDADAFGYLFTGANPWWSRVLGGGLVEVFGVETGRKSDLSFIGGGLANVGGAQYLWLEAALKASTARYKIIMLHHPPATCSDDPDDTIAEFANWEIFSRADLILCGHAHLSEWLIWKGVSLVNLSGAVRTDGAIGDFPASPIFMNQIDPLVGKITVTPDDMVVEFVDTASGRSVLTRSVYDKVPRSVTLQGWVVDQATLVEVYADTIFAFSIIGEPLTVRSVTFGHASGEIANWGTCSITKGSGGPAIVASTAMGTTKRVSSNSIVAANRDLLPGDKIFVRVVSSTEPYETTPKGFYVQVHCDLYA